MSLGSHFRERSHLLIVLRVLFCAQEFIRVGYYVNNEYMEEELRETPPEKVQIDRSALPSPSMKPC